MNECLFPALSEVNGSNAVSVPMKRLAVSFCLILLVFLGVVGKSFALPSCPSSGVFHNCFGTATYADGRKYVGECKNNRPSGLGIRTYADGRVEEGVFEDGKFLYAEKATPDKEDSALATEETQDSAFASNDAKPFFSCKLPPLTGENGFICADASSGTKDCGGLGMYVIEYDLVDNQMFNKQVEVGKSQMEEAQKDKILNQEF